MRDIFVQEVLKAALRDKNIFFLTADLGFGAFDILEKKLKERYINVGVSEQNMIGIATGLAMEGKKVITYSIANFSFMRCLEQIRNDAAYHNCNVTIVSNGSGFSYGQLGMSHHATEDIAIMSAIPNIQVHSPATQNDISFIVKYSIKNKSVNYIRLDKSIYSNNLKYKFNKKKSVNYYSGKDAHIFVTGAIASIADDLVKRLRNKKFQCGMSVIHTLKPFCDEDILRITSKIKNIIVIEEHNRIGGLSFLISEILTKNKILLKNYLACNTGDDFTYEVGSQNYLRNLKGLELNNILKKVLKFK